MLWRSLLYAISAALTVRVRRGRLPRSLLALRPGPPTLGAAVATSAGSGRPRRGLLLARGLMFLTASIVSLGVARRNCASPSGSLPVGIPLMRNNICNAWLALRP